MLQPHIRPSPKSKLIKYSHQTPFHDKVHPLEQINNGIEFHVALHAVESLNWMRLDKWNLKEIAATHKAPFMSHSCGILTKAFFRFIICWPMCFWFVSPVQLSMETIQSMLAEVSCMFKLTAKVWKQFTSVKQNGNFLLLIDKKK